MREPGGSEGNAAGSHEESTEADDGKAGQDPDEFVNRVPLSVFVPARAFDPRGTPADLQALRKWIRR